MMKKPLTTLLLMSSSLLLLACNDSSSSSTSEQQSIQLQTQPVTLSSEPISPIIAEQDYVSFIRPMSGLYQTTQSHTQQQQKSDQYWFTVSGKALKQGFELPITQTNAAIRITPQFDRSKQQASARIQLDNIEFTPVNGSQQAVIAKRIDADKLATAGIFAQSNALTLLDSAPIGNYRLQINQAIADNDSYLINVKEKNSPHQLSLRTNMTIKAGETIKAELSLSQQTLQQAPNAVLFDNQGQSYPLTAQQKAGLWSFSRSNGAPLPASQHLMALEISTEQIIDQQLVKRSIRTAIKQHSHTAQLMPQVQAKWQQQLPQQLDFKLDVASASRFDVSAIITGTNSQGQEVNIMQTQAAQWLEAGQQQLTLTIDSSLINAAKVKAPFYIRDLTLTDQGQLVRLSQQTYATQLNQP